MVTGLPVCLLLRTPHLIQCKCLASGSLSKLVDFILANQFIKWFTPSVQTAYQQKKSSADHVFLLRCLIHQAKKSKRTLFIIGDFDGAFDRISGSLLSKLIKSGLELVSYSSLALLQCKGCLYHHICSFSTSTIYLKHLMKCVENCSYIGTCR